MTNRAGMGTTQSEWNGLAQGNDGLNASTSENDILLRSANTHSKEASDNLSGGNDNSSKTTTIAVSVAVGSLACVIALILFVFYRKKNTSNLKPFNSNLRVENMGVEIPLTVVNDNYKGLPVVDTNKTSDEYAKVDLTNKEKATICLDTSNEMTPLRQPSSGQQPDNDDDFVYEMTPLDQPSSGQQPDNDDDFVYEMTPLDQPTSGQQPDNDDDFVYEMTPLHQPSSGQQPHNDDDFVYEDSFFPPCPPPQEMVHCVSGSSSAVDLVEDGDCNMTMVDNCLYVSMGEHGPAGPQEGQSVYKLASNVVGCTNNRPDTQCDVSSDNTGPSPSNLTERSNLPHDYDPVYVPSSDEHAMERRLDPAGYVRSSRVRLSTNSNTYEELPEVSTPPLGNSSPSLPHRNASSSLTASIDQPASPHLPHPALYQLAQASPSLPKRNPPMAVFTCTNTERPEKASMRHAWDAPPPIPVEASQVMGHFQAELDVTVPPWHQDRPNHIAEVTHMSQRDFQASLPKRNPPMAVFTCTNTERPEKATVRHAWDAPPPIPVEASQVMGHSQTDQDMTVPLWHQDRPNHLDEIGDEDHVYSSVSDEEAGAECAHMSQRDFQANFDDVEQVYETLDEDAREDVYEDVDF